MWSRRPEGGQQVQPRSPRSVLALQVEFTPVTCRLGRRKAVLPVRSANKSANGSYVSVIRAAILDVRNLWNSFQDRCENG